MEGVLTVTLPPSKRPKLNNRPMDYDLCILCQKRSDEELVARSSKASKLFESLSLRSQHGDTKFQHAYDTVCNMSVEDLQLLNGRWHLACYKQCTHQGHLNRLQARNQEKEATVEEHVASSSEPTTLRTRSQGIKLDKCSCFFCDETESRTNPLYTVATERTGKKLYDAVNLSDNPKWKLKLSGCLDPSDAHAYDIAYHLSCYTKYVVTPLRSKVPAMCKQSTVSHVAGKTDFITSLTDTLLDGKVVSIAEAEDHYREICKNNGVAEEDLMNRKSLKSFIADELLSMNVEFSNPLRKNLPQRISLKSARDVVISQAEEGCRMDTNMKTVFEAAKIIRKCILASKKWNFEGSLVVDKDTDPIPKEIEYFFRWCIAGYSKLDDKDMVNSKVIANRASNLSQSLIYECISDRQVHRQECVTVKHMRSLPLQVGVGLTIHSTTRSKSLVQLMHSFGCSIEYSKVLRLETSIANEIMQRMEADGGIYIPPDLTYGRYIFCAADNIDFLEDTPDGKGTLHGTVMTCYQEISSEDCPEAFHISARTTDRSLKTLPASMKTTHEHRPQRNNKTSTLSFPERVVNTPVTEVKQYTNLDIIWLMSKCAALSNALLSPEHLEKNVLQITTEPADIDESTDEDKGCESRKNFIPTWSAFNSILQSAPDNQTRVCVLPIISASPTLTSVQLTFLQQLESLTHAICGNSAKCVLTLDLGLYRPVQQLILSRQDLQNRWILRPGELHLLFAAIRALGCFTDGTGITDLWSILYSDNTISHIIDGKNFRRAMEAHTRMFVALQSCYIEAFYVEHPEIHDILNEKLQIMRNALFTSDADKVLNDLESTMSACDLGAKLNDFDVEKSRERPTFRMLRQYMQMMHSFLLIVRSIRTGNWELHLEAVEQFVKYFFALDLNNYSGMISLYIAQMKDLKESDPAMWSEFKRGNWVVKRSKVPFCALGSDEALEQQNRALKVTGGLVGITQNPQALARFFLTAPELHRLSEETQRMTLSSHSIDKQRHHLSTETAATKQDKAILKLISELARVGNPFLFDGPELINIASKAVFDADISKDVLRVEDLGTDLYNAYKCERLIKGTESVWAPMKRNKLKLCSSASKKRIKVKIAETVNDLTNDRSLFARLLIVSRSQRDVDLSDMLGKYELSAVPRSMFSSDGTMHQCPSKSKLFHILKSLDGEGSNTLPTFSGEQSGFCVAVVDGMAELQALTKSNAVQNCADLADAFIQKLEMKYRQFDELHIVFDSYKEQSIKNITRDKRLHGGTATRYKIDDNTDISSVTMKKLLSHSATKDELTEFLSRKIILKAPTWIKRCVVAWRNDIAATLGDVAYLKSTQEEADTKMILHGIDAKVRGATTLLIFANDTDVLVLLVRRYEVLPNESYFVPSPGQYISIGNIFRSLGREKAAALPGFHALSGCDTTGCFKGKGKQSYWKAFESTDTETLHTFAVLGSSEVISDDLLNKLEEFVCHVYKPNTKITHLSALRWSMFSATQTVGDRLPPTRDSFVPAVKRANLQAMIWMQDDTANPTVPSPVGNGWVYDEGQLRPVMCDTACAPESLLQLIKCSCSKNRCAPPCKCRANNLPCTDICGCSANENICDNIYAYHNDVENTDSGEEEED